MTAPSAPVARPPIGITTTIPIEIPYAAGRTVCDLNNRFVADPSPNRFIDAAEAHGFPTTCCAWTKGLYGLLHGGAVREVIGVVEGDCSESSAMLDVLRSEGYVIHPFAYPHGRSRRALEEGMRALAGALGTDPDAAEAMKAELDAVRELARDIDEAAWRGNAVESGVLFSCLLALTDFLGDVEACRTRLARVRAEVGSGSASGTGVLTGAGRIRLGCVGVPTILHDLWERIEGFGGRVVYHEVPLEFSGVRQIGVPLADAYTDFSYPYDAAHRMDVLAAEVERRGLAGVIHYVQTFCHRQIHDRLLRERLRVPVLTLEADRPGRVDGRTETRIEAFLEQLRG